MRTVELLFDSGLDEAVRALWDRLHAAGLKSLATHRHPTNSPHVTLASGVPAGELTAPDLPFPVSLGPARLLGRAVVLEATPTPSLLKAQSAAWESFRDRNPLHAPDAWMPHVSLALNVPPSDAAAALFLLADLPPMAGQVVAARSYDSATRTVTGLVRR